MGLIMAGVGVISMKEESMDIQADTSGETKAISELAFSQMTQAILNGIERQLDDWLQDDVIDIDGTRSGGVLELVFPNQTKIVINTQPPLRELWLASKAGGFHFRCINGRWVDTKQGEEFFFVLSKSASQQAGKELIFSAS
jgi:CyaY protein